MNNETQNMETGVVVGNEFCYAYEYDVLALADEPETTENTGIVLQTENETEIESENEAEDQNEAMSENEAESPNDETEFKDEEAVEPGVELETKAESENKTESPNEVESEDEKSTETETETEPETEAKVESEAELQNAVEPQEVKADTISTWEDLQKAIDNGGDIKLTENITAGETDKELIVESGNEVTIDLNGCAINRALESIIYHGYVIRVEGTLTVKDTSDGQAGKITGGFNGDLHGSDSTGGGVYVDSDATLNFEGGQITGNKAYLAVVSTLKVQ